MPQKQQEALALMREVLQEDLLQLQAEGYKLEESLSGGRCDVFLTVRNPHTGELFPIDGTGVGLVDAVFRGLKARFTKDYQSLESIEFASFEVKGIMNSGHDALTDAEARVEIGVRNSFDRLFHFETQSRSIGKACIDGLLRTVEYFVNSELAFVRMYKARSHYESEGRNELVSKYTAMMTQMVANTSYSEVIDRIQKEALA